MTAFNVFVPHSVFVFTVSKINALKIIFTR